MSEHSKFLVQKFLKENNTWNPKANAALIKLFLQEAISNEQFKYILDKWGRKTYDHAKALKQAEAIKSVFGDAVNL